MPDVSSAVNAAEGRRSAPREPSHVVVELAKSLNAPARNARYDAANETLLPVADPGDDAGLLAPSGCADPLSASEGKTYTHEGSGNFRLHNVLMTRGSNLDIAEDVTGTLGSNADRASGSAPIVFGMRADAAREGEAKTASPDAEGRVRRRDPGFNVSEELAPTLDASAPPSVGPVANTLRAESGRQQVESTYVVVDEPTPLLAHGASGAKSAGIGRAGDPAPALDTSGAAAVMTFDPNQVTHRENRSRCDADTSASRCDADTSASLPAQPNAPVAFGPATSVRRLTPRECERLMGQPDDATLVPYRGKPAQDGPRYKSLGNSMVVQVMAWLGKRIEQVARAARENPQETR